MRQLESRNGQPDTQNAEPFEKHPMLQLLKHNVKCCGPLAEYLEPDPVTGEYNIREPYIRDITQMGVLKVAREIPSGVPPHALQQAILYENTVIEPPHEITYHQHKKAGKNGYTITVFPGEPKGGESKEDLAAYAPRHVFIARDELEDLDNCVNTLAGVKKSPNDRPISYIENGQFTLNNDAPPRDIADYFGHRNRALLDDKFAAAGILDKGAVFSNLLSLICIDEALERQQGKGRQTKAATGPQR